MPLLTPEDYTQFPEVPPDATYAYGDDPAQFGVLYLPDTETPYPVIILVHGGCYREQYDLKPMGSVARALVADGFAVWNIEYRRAGNGGDYPHMFLDVGLAADYLRHIADRHSLDLDHVITVGHSAGGHLATWLAVRRKIRRSSAIYRDNPLPVKGVIGLAGILDLNHAVNNGICEGALTVVLGEEAEAVAEHFQAASPRALLPLGVPQTHIVGDHDTEIMTNVKPYVEAARDAGDTVQLIIPKGAGHFEIVDVRSQVWQIVRDAIVAMKSI